MKSVYFFGHGVVEGDAQMREELGGKGANLAEMTRIGIPVPPGFTISTAVCNRYLEDRGFTLETRSAVDEAMARLEAMTGRRFGDPSDPLLVSVRSGAAVSMPGMMESILDLGLNDATVEGLATRTENPRFAYDSYRRLIQMYGEVVKGVPAQLFEQRLAALLEARGYERELECTAEDWAALVTDYKAIYQRSVGAAFPSDVWEQLRGSVAAVFESFHGKRAVDYRRVHHLPDDIGTAVNVMAMVYGNMGADSGTGVVFTRDPATGERGIYGEYLMNAQGEDVVAGIRDPEPITGLREVMPAAYTELEAHLGQLERHYTDMQDIEFTIERGRLYILQTRSGKRTARAAVRIAVDMVDEGLIDRKTAIGRVQPEQLDQLLHPVLDPRAEVDVLTTGLPAAPGAAVGRVVFDPEVAVAKGEAGEPVILVRHETSPDDFHGMVAARGILTEKGGMTSHAAVVARGMGRCCVAGAGAIEIGADQSFAVDGRVVRAGDWLTLDGSTGRVILGEAALIDPQLTGELETLMGWADEVRRLAVHANADNPDDALRARELGATGIGLCRTEHMFFGDDRIEVMRQMILAEDADGRADALAKLLPMQRQDFHGIFAAMDGLPVTIRLLDPPLHEFLPKDTAEIERVAGLLGVDVAHVRHRIDVLSETNPMLGHRGCRLGISHPEITAMQSRAVFEAACDALAEGIEARPQVMVPLIGHGEELRRQRAVVQETAEAVLAERGQELPIVIGTMIELPRAALRADRIAQRADFFSFGTNDLTQMTWGLSRDDAGQFLPMYEHEGILTADPFQTIDEVGVGQLVEIGVQRGRATKPDLEVGICGEHGGDPQSIAFFHRVGLDYVSCSPFRVPIARLAAAQAALRAE